MAHKARVLFVCVHNSARSQLAEAYLRKLAGNSFEVESAGIEAGSLNPYVVRVLAEEGIDISGKKTQEVAELYRAKRTFEYVVTVCSKEAEERCPFFPGLIERQNWPFPDPATFAGGDEQIMSQTRLLRDQIKHRVERFVEQHRSQGRWSSRRERSFPASP